MCWPAMAALLQSAPQRQEKLVPDEVILLLTTQVAWESQWWLSKGTGSAGQGNAVAQQLKKTISFWELTSPVTSGHKYEAP